MFCCFLPSFLQKCPELHYTRGCTETECIGALKIMTSLQVANARAREVAIMDPKEVPPYLLYVRNTICDKPSAKN